MKRIGLLLLMVFLVSGSVSAKLISNVVAKQIDFQNWYYRLDPTHLSFYTPETMKWIGKRWDWLVCSPVENVYLFRKPII